ncbi:M15 family metallopeptidase [Agrobacterium sp. ST15.13.015]|uniref:M15 family metallopeptidase n=1 Tax=Agrobacterium sp. ST15.13.015 TaxID=3017319 RepID=UPI003FA426EF
MRDDAEQNRLFVKGLSKAKAGQSPHGFGYAVDIIHSTKAWDLTRKQWELIAHVADEVARAMGIMLKWGGEWDGDVETSADRWDPAHFEIMNWKARRVCEHSYVRYNREVDGTVNPVTTKRCVHCGFQGFQS